MKKKFQQMTDSQKIDYLLEKVERIDATINPPFWKKVAHWGMTHWVFVLAFIAMGYALWNMWDEIQTLLVFVNKVNTSVDNVQTEFGEVKTQINRITESLGNTVEGFKFWK